jgi:hypothetical protein
MAKSIRKKGIHQKKLQEFRNFYYIFCFKNQRSPIQEALMSSITSSTGCPVKYYYPQANSLDTEDIALIKKMHALYAKYLAATQPGHIVTLPPDVGFVHPVSRLESHWQRFIFSKGFALKDWIVVKLDANDIIERVTLAIAERDGGRASESDYSTHSYSHLELDQAKEKKMQSS